jgi:hypothetical protein
MGHSRARAGSLKLGHSKPLTPATADQSLRPIRPDIAMVGRVDCTHVDGGNLQGALTDRQRPIRQDLRD